MALSNIFSERITGGLAAAIGLMVWMEFSAMIVFLGVAWNAENT
jgi:membrane protein